MIHGGSRESRSWGFEVGKRDGLGKGNAAGSEDDPEPPLGSGESGKGQRVGINSGAVPPFGQATCQGVSGPGGPKGN